MTTAQVEVTRAARGEHGKVGRALGAAFVDDPVFQWLIPVGVARRDERLATFFSSMARSYLRRDKNVYLAGDGVGGALWSAPGSWALPMTEVAREAVPSTKAFGRQLLRALRCQLSIEAKHPDQPAHWYLGYLGVASGHQGQGIGAAMLRAVLDDADRAGVPAYLESSNERNLTLYERHGFRVVESMPLLGVGPTVWRMWREP
ncbi:MAG TPA: GNAT family N-acetyltransferase [Mycobacteriales bacterium]|nr:GNAT family N-acetyltransferase [Mycobacteriales bacterium]